MSSRMKPWLYGSTFDPIKLFIVAKITNPY